MDGEPIDSLARRAMANLNNNGVGNDVRDMARRALNNMDGGLGGDIRDIARKALDNLNGGQSGCAGGIQEMAKAAL